MQNRLNLNPTDFVPLARCSFDTISVYLCLPVSVGLQLRAEGEGGGGGAMWGGRGSQYYYRLHCPGWPRRPGPRAQLATYPLSVLVRDSVLWPGHCPEPPPPSPGKVYNNKMLNWIPSIPAHCSSLSSCLLLLAGYNYKLNSKALSSFSFHPRSLFY